MHMYIYLLIHLHAFTLNLHLILYAFANIINNKLNANMEINDIYYFSINIKQTM